MNDSSQDPTMTDAFLWERCTRFTFGGPEYTEEVHVEPRDAERTQWAVCCLKRCLNVDGGWEWEPSPSNRDDDFIARTRFDRMTAIAMAMEITR